MNVGVYEAKSRLSELLQQVRSGKEVVITSHGKPIARLIPAGETVTPDRAEAARKIRALRKRLNIRTRVSTRTLDDEGRD
jgi:prevent-host-death family protein